MPWAAAASGRRRQNDLTVEIIAVEGHDLETEESGTFVTL